MGRMVSLAETSRVGVRAQTGCPVEAQVLYLALVHLAQRGQGWAPAGPPGRSSASPETSHVVEQAVG